jgi:hypothetical protein
MPAATEHPLVGAWEKITVSACSESYPDRIVFQPNGLYAGHRDPPGTFTTWDVGKLVVIDAGHVRMTTANDAHVTYIVTISGDVVTFVDPDLCAFSYRRASP